MLATFRLRLSQDGYVHRRRHHTHRHAHAIVYIQRARKENTHACTDPFLNGQRQRRRQYRIPRTNAPPTLDQPPSNHGRPFERRVSVHTRNTPQQRESSAHRPAQPYKHGAKHSMRRALVQCAHTRTSSMCIRTTHKRSKLRWPPTLLRCHTEGTSNMRFQISFLSPGSTTRSDTQ